jgi:hypothetical protein
VPDAGSVPIGALTAVSAALTSVSATVSLNERTLNHTAAASATASAMKKTVRKESFFS